MNAETFDPSNLSQLKSWDGQGGDFWVENADRFDAGVAAYRADFLTATAISGTSHVLDIGCGTGQTTRDAARTATAGHALGLDLSGRMVELARLRASREQVFNVSFEQADAQVYDFPEGGFDVAISRHGAMFFGDPTTAFTNIGRALCPGGRLVLLTWQPFDSQEWLSSFLTTLSVGEPVPVPPSEGPSPFALSDPDRIQSLLSKTGFVDVRLDDMRAPMYFGADVEDALRFVAGQHSGMLDKLNSENRGRALDDLRDSLKAHLGEGGVFYDSAAWLVRAHRP